VPVFVRAAGEDLFRTLSAGLSRIERGAVPSGVTSATYSSGIDRDLKTTG
jgi:hypothetical protein